MGSEVDAHMYRGVVQRIASVVDANPPGDEGLRGGMRDDI